MKLRGTPNGRNENLDRKFAQPLPTEIECAGQTDRGRVRATNQDQFLIADLHKEMQIQASSQPQLDEHQYGISMGHLLFVADGMGGMRGGDVASEVAIHSMAQYLLNSMHWLFHPTQPEIDKFMEDLKVGAMYSHENVRRVADQDPACRGMGTTLTVAYLLWPMLYVVHVGDSRCYILRDRSLQLLTHDQTLAQHLHDHGQLNDDEYSDSPLQHVLLSSIGASDAPDAIVYKTRLVKGDRVMLCTDGVNKHLQDSEIEQVLSTDQSAVAICQKIVTLTNERGGEDNITAVVAVSR